MMANTDTTICSVARSRPASARRGGFTIAEILVVVFVIGVLVSIIMIAINKSSEGARRQAGQATVVSLGQAIEQFEQTFGFPPPLVQDGIQGTGGAMDVEPAVLARDGTQAEGHPVEVVPGNEFIRMAVTYNPALAPNRRFLEGLDPTETGAPTAEDLINRYLPGTDEWLTANQRYSKYTLGIYLAAALPAALAGVAGPGMVRPLADGTFEGVRAGSADPLATEGRSTARERFDAFYDADTRSSRVTREYFSEAEYHENDPDSSVPTDPADETDWRHVAITDANGVAYRYYRWLPLSEAYGINVSATYQLNIPWVLLDDGQMNRLEDAGDHESASVIDLTGGDAELRGASWAVVGAGEDGLFGTEPIETLRGTLNLSESEFEDWEVRAQAKSDNLVEVGR